jgi:hypothetical protein
VRGMPVRRDTDRGGATALVGQEHRVVDGHPRDVS